MKICSLNVGDADIVFLSRSFHFCEFARHGVDDVAVEVNALWHEGMAANGLYGFAHGILGVVEPFKPVVEIDAAELNGVEHVLTDAALEHEGFHLTSVHVAGTAIGMGDDHYFFHPQLVYGHKQAAHG